MSGTSQQADNAYHPRPHIETSGMQRRDPGSPGSDPQRPQRHTNDSPASSPRATFAALASRGRKPPDADQSPAPSRMRRPAPSRVEPKEISFKPSEVDFAPSSGDFSSSTEEMFTSLRDIRSSFEASCGSNRDSSLLPESAEFLASNPHAATAASLGVARSGGGTTAAVVGGAAAALATDPSQRNLIVPPKSTTANSAVTNYPTKPISGSNMFSMPAAGSHVTSRAAMNNTGNVSHVQHSMEQSALHNDKPFRQTQRIRRGGSFDHLFNDHQSSDSSERTPPNPILEQLESYISETDYHNFLICLDIKATEPGVVAPAMVMFAKHVVRDQTAKPNSVVLIGGNWVKTITGKMVHLMNERNVVFSALQLLLTLSTLPGDYKKYLVKNGALEAAVKKVLVEYRGDFEIGSLVWAFVNSLSLNDKDGLNAKYKEIAFIIRKMAEIIADPQDFGKEFAVRSLYHLSNQRKPSQTTKKPLAHDVCSALSNERMVQALTEVIQTEGTNEVVVESALCLLWRLSVFKEEQENKDITLLSADLVGSVLFAMGRYDKSIIIQEASCGLLANLANMSVFPNESALPAAEAICICLSNPDYGDDEGLATSGTHAICNLLADSARRSEVMRDNRILKVLFRCMSQFPKCEEVQENCCLSIGHACNGDINSKIETVEAGGLELVLAACQNFVITQEEPSLEVKDAALCAFATLAGCDPGARKMVETGIADILETLLVVEADEGFKEILQVIIRNTRTGVSSGFKTGFSDDLKRRPGILAQTLRNADSAETVESLLQDFKALTGQADIPTAGKIAPFAEEGFDALLEAMGRYNGSPQIQEDGCYILADLFYRVPISDLQSPAQLLVGTWAWIHTQKAIETVQLAMRNHRRNVGVQDNACLALCNFLAPLCDPQQPNSTDREIVSRWVDGCFKDVLDVMVVLAGDPQAQISAINLFWTLSFVCNRDTMTRWKERVLEHIFDAMKRYPTNSNLNLAACDILIALENDVEGLAILGGAKCIAALWATLELGDEEVVGRSTQILSTALTAVDTACSHVLDVPDSIKKLVNCMTIHIGSSDIQYRVCSIMESLVAFEERHVGSLIGECGGVKAVGDTLIYHGSDGLIVEMACSALALIIPAVRESVIYSSRTALGNALILALQIHVENPSVSSAVMDVLATLCGQDEYFKRTLLGELSALEAIIRAMNENLGSAEVQRSGCSLIWIMSGYEQGRQILGEHGGIAAVVNGMLANPDHSGVQKEGLTALKNLATASCNKPLIASVQGEDAVLYALWIHIRDPQVISGAFSALNNIAVDSDTRQVADLKVELWQVILVAMKRFPNEEQVQKNACFLLKSCSYSEHNLELMCRSSDRLTPLLLRAAQTFPEQCRDRAMSVISKMERHQNPR